MTQPSGHDSGTMIAVIGAIGGAITLVLGTVLKQVVPLFKRSRKEEQRCMLMGTKDNPVIFHAITTAIPEETKQQIERHEVALKNVDGKLDHVLQNMLVLHTNIVRLAAKEGVETEDIKITNH